MRPSQQAATRAGGLNIRILARVGNKGTRPTTTQPQLAPTTPNLRHTPRKLMGCRLIAVVSLFLPIASPALAEIYGDISTRIESQSTFYPRHYDASYGYVKYVYAQAFLRNDERPGWFGGFALIQERARGIDPDTRGGDNDIAHGYFGKFGQTRWGSNGWEVAAGFESLSGIRIRPRYFLRVDINQSYYFAADFAYSYYGHSSRIHEIDEDAHALLVKTALHYRRTAHSGMFVESFWRPNIQSRNRFGNIVSEELYFKFGSWQNFKRLYTTFWLELGGVNTFNDRDGEVFVNYYKYLIGARLGYRFTDLLRLTGTLSYERQWHKRGLWVPVQGQDSDEVSFDIGLSFDF